MEKLLALALLVQRTYGRWLFQRLLSGIVVVAGLTIITSIMVSAILISSLVAAYFALLHYGIEQQAALLIISITVILTIVALIILTLACLHHLRQMPRTLLKRSPLTARAMDTLDAFSDGLTAD